MTNDFFCFSFNLLLTFFHFDSQPELNRNGQETNLPTNLVCTLFLLFDQMWQGEKADVSTNVTEKNASYTREGENYTAI